MWIFKWAFRFPTCSQMGAQNASHGAWPLPHLLKQGIMDFLVPQRARAPLLTEALGPGSRRKTKHSPF